MPLLWRSRTGSGNLHRALGTFCPQKMIRSLDLGTDGPPSWCSATKRRSSLLIVQNKALPRWNLYCVCNSETSISCKVFPFVSTTCRRTNIAPTTHADENIVYRTCGPSCSKSRKNNKLTKKLTPQCTDIHRAMALARILFGKISGKRSPGTGPAPNENAKTNSSMPPTERYTLAEPR